MTEDTRGKVTAGVANPGAGAGAGAGDGADARAEASVGAGTGAGAGGLLQVCTTFPTKW